MTASRIYQNSKVSSIRAIRPSARLREARRMAGVTLIELVVTLSIATILMTIAVPSLSLIHISQGIVR